MTPILILSHEVGWFVGVHDALQSCRKGRSWIEGAVHDGSINSLFYNSVEKWKLGCKILLRPASVILRPLMGWPLFNCALRFLALPLHCINKGKKLQKNTETITYRGKRDDLWIVEVEALG